LFQGNQAEPDEENFIKNSEEIMETKTFRQIAVLGAEKQRDGRTKFIRGKRIKPGDSVTGVETKSGAASEIDSQVADHQQEWKETETETALLI
jgi:hypothetical protein